MDKVVYVKARFKAVGKYETVKIPTGEKKAGLFGGEKDVTREEKKWVQTGFSDREIDGELLAQDVQKEVEELNRDGYQVVAISEIISGQYDWKLQSVNQGGYGYGYGYSYTEGLIIVARKNQ